MHVHAGRWRGRSDVLAPRRGRAQQQRLQEGPAPSAAESSDGHERRALAPPLGDSSCRAPAKDSPPTALAPPPSRRTCTAGSGGGFVGRASGGHSTRGYTSLSGSDSPSALRSAAPRASLAAPPAAAKKRVRFSQSVSVSRPPDGVAAPRLPPAPSARAGAPRPAPRLPPSLHRQNLGAIGALAIRERYGDGSDSVYSGLSPRSHALRRHRQSLVAAAAAASASSVAGEYRSLLQGTAPLRPHATPAARALGKAPSAASARRGLGAAGARLAAEDEVPVRVKMLSYMLPVEEKVSFAEGDASSFTPLSEDRSPVSETKPLLPADDKPDKLASLEGDLQALESPSTEEVKLIMDEKEKEKTEEPEGEPVEDEDDLEKTPRGLASGGGGGGEGGGEGGSPAASEDKSVFSESLASPGSDDRSIIKTTSTKPSLKRVSFGSSKGSMVETLIYDSPVAEEERIPEEEVPSFRDPVSQKFGTEIAAQQKPASKVRVTFYESSKPLVVTSPEPSDFDQYSPQDFLMASPLTDAHMPGFDRQLSSDSGRDNPFRPDGDISREADEIVQLIKSGRPLQQPPEDALDGTAPLEASSPAHEKEVAAEPLLPRPDAHRQPQALHATPANAARTHSPTADGASKGGATSPSAGAASPSKAGANGSAAPEASMPGTVEVTHATVTPTDPAHVEHVVIRKKSKCNCCVIQ